MSETPVGRLKQALIEHLTDAIEDGAKAVDPETGELVRLTCPANVLAVAAKVVKDFHEESGPTQGERELNAVVEQYKLIKGREGKAAH